MCGGDERTAGFPRLLPDFRDRQEKGKEENITEGCRPRIPIQ